MTKKIPNPNFQIALLAPVLVAAILLAGLISPANAQTSSGPLEVVLAGKPARKTLTLTSTQPARIEGLEQTPIHSRIADYVGEVLVDFGDHVKKDQPLLKLFAPEREADLEQKRALLEQTRAQLLQAEAGAKAATAAIVTAQSKAIQFDAGIDRAKSDLTRWRAEYARVSSLANSGSLNRQLADETQQKLGAAEASLKEAAAAIEAAKAGVAQAQAEAAKAAADVTAAKAQIRVAEANLAQSAAENSYLTLKAPFDGVILSRKVDPGHFVQPASAGTAPLFVIAKIDKLRVFVSVPEVEAPYIDLGDTVTIEVPSLRGAEFKGAVTRTSFALDAANRSLETIIDLDNAAGRLRPGLYATAKITLQEQKDALTLPSAAVVRQPKEAFCYRLIGGKATKTPIQLGIKVGDDFEVTSGLTDADKVILNKASSLKDGQAVEELKPPPAKS